MLTTVHVVSLRRGNALHISNAAPNYKLLTDRRSVAVFYSRAGYYLYGRDCNPTVRHLGGQLAALEGTEAAYATASGANSTLL